MRGERLHTRYSLLRLFFHHSRVKALCGKGLESGQRRVYQSLAQEDLTLVSVAIPLSPSSLAKRDSPIALGFFALGMYCPFPLRLTHSLLHQVAPAMLNTTSSYAPLFQFPSPLFAAAESMSGPDLWALLQ